MFRNGDITEVRIPPALDEAVRDLCRARNDASGSFPKLGVLCDLCGPVS